jgi:transmembrane sensor
MENRNYEQYDTEDFLTDERFIRWVISPTAESDQFWTEWIEAHPDRSEVLQQSRILLRSVRFRSFSPDQEQYSRVLEKIREGKYSRRHSAVKRILPQLSKTMIRNAAAVLLILLTVGGLVWYFYPGFRTPAGQPDLVYLTTQNGERTTYTLPDGSQVRLNAGSKLTYPSVFRKECHIALEGEAFFDVTKDPSRPFTVHTGQISTTVLGTTFNINAYAGDGSVTVALKTGKVAVKQEVPGKWDQIYLVPGEKLTYDEGTGTAVKEKLVPDDLAWTEGVIVLNKVSFNDFVRIIERWYGADIEIIGHPREDWLINGRFKNKPLAVVLESVSFAENINYTLENNHVTLNFNN